MTTTTSTTTTSTTTTNITITPPWCTRAEEPLRRGGSQSRPPGQVFTPEGPRAASVSAYAEAARARTCSC
jgi:hypothetical protein